MKGAPRTSEEKTTGAGERSRTPDLRITNALLYQLSYAGVTISGADYTHSRQSPATHDNRSPVP